jgi:hypothetical protein
LLQKEEDYNEEDEEYEIKNIKDKQNHEDERI